MSADIAVRQNGELAFAKLNLTMDIIGRLDEGYHAVRSVMQSIDFGDRLVIAGSPDGQLRAESQLRYLPTGEKNIAVRAMRLFRERTGKGPEAATIKIDKRIPVCGGLGGSSTDGAAVLRVLNREYGAGLSYGELELLSAELGSDTPFCVRGGTVLAEGRGDVMTRIEPGIDCWVAIIKPDFSSSTPELFNLIDGVKNLAHPDTQGMIEAIQSGELREVARRMFNVFEEVLPRRQLDMVSEAKHRLMDSGALGASMSGTGSAVFGIYEGESQAKQAVKVLRNAGIISYYAKTLPMLV